MREDYRVSAIVENLARGAVAGMRTAGDHAYPLHLVEHLPAKASQSAVLVLTAAADAIVTVIGHEHPADAEIIIERDQADLVADTIGALDVEADREAATLTRLLYVVDRLDQEIAVGPCRDPAPEVREHL